MTPPPSVGPRFLRLAAVADELATTTSQVYALVRSGELRAIQIGGRNQWRVERVTGIPYTHAPRFTPPTSLPDYVDPR